MKTRIQSASAILASLFVNVAMTQPALAHEPIVPIANTDTGQRLS